MLWPSDRFRHLIRALIAPVLLIAAGTVAIMVVLDQAPVDAPYQTVFTLTAVGLGRLPDATGGEAVTIVSSVARVAIFVYLFGLVIELTVGGLFGGVLQRRVRQRMGRLENHYGACCYGRMGRRVASELTVASAHYVVVNPDAETIAAGSDVEVPEFEVPFRPQELVG